jgi:hypothetical protein
MKLFTVFVLCFLAFNVWALQPFEDNSETATRIDNTWIGFYSSNWYDNNNWSLGHTPNQNENVFIQPSGNLCNILLDAYCANLTIQSGASLMLSSGNLYVYGNTDIYGAFYNPNPANIYFNGNLTLRNGCTVFIEPQSSSLYLTGNLTVFNPASLIIISSFHMMGQNKTITSFSQTFIANFNIDNMASVSVSPAGSGFNLMGNLFVLPGGSFANLNSNPIRIVGNLFAWSWDPMSDVAFIGDAESYVNMHGSALRNVYVQKQSPTAVRTVIMDADLTITGDLTIFQGGVYAHEHTLYLGGDFTDYSVGGTGFAAGTGNVVFNGPALQAFMGNVIFNRVTLDKPGAGLDGTLRIDLGISIDIASYDWNAGTLCADGGIINILDLYDDFLAGNYQALEYGILNITQDNAGGLDFSGEMLIEFDGSINIFGGRSNLVISAPGSLEISNGSLNVLQGLEMQDGTTYGNSYGNLLVAGDLIINTSLISGDNFGEVHLMGNTDNVLKISPGTLMNPLFVQKDNCILNMTGDVNLGNSMQVSGGNLRTNGFYLSVDGFASVTTESGYQGHLEVNGGTLSIGAEGYLTVGNGGKLSVLGNETDRAVVTAVNPSLGRYQFIVMDGGTLAADYARFEYMGQEGIRFDTNALVDPVHSLNNCVFDYVADSGTLLTVLSGQDITVTNAIFPARTALGTVYNVSKTADSGSVSFVNQSGAFSGAAFENDPFGRINWQENAPAVSDLAISTVPGVIPTQLILNWSYPIPEAVFNIYSSDSMSESFILEFPSVSGTSQTVTPGSAKFYYIRAVVNP